MLVPVVICKPVAPPAEAGAAGHAVPAAHTLEYVLQMLTWYETAVLCVAPTAAHPAVARALQAQQLEGHMLLADTAGTTAALALAATHLHRLGLDPLMLICPDNLPLREAASIAQAVRQAEPAAQAGAIVAMGMLPSLAGPVVLGARIDPGAARHDGSRAVACFDPHTPAQGTAAHTDMGYSLCNTGLYLARASVLLEALTRHTPTTVQACQTALNACPQHSAGGHVTLWPHAQALQAGSHPSFETAVLARHQPLAVVGLHATWVGHPTANRLCGSPGGVPVAASASCPF